MDAHQHNPNPFDTARINRREALMGVAGLGALVLGAVLLDKARSYISRMTPEQRHYVKGVIASDVSWIQLPSDAPNESRWMAKNADGASVTVSVRQTHNGEWHSVEISDSAKPFTYRCPQYRQSAHDKPVMDQLLASVRTPSK